MGRIEKKFQKKKDRERAVRKKILARRAKSRKASKEMQKADKLERAINKRDHKPIRKTDASPELERVLEMVDKIKAEEKDDPSKYGLPPLMWADKDQREV